jgi:hypothetical protein
MINKYKDNKYTIYGLIFRKEIKRLLQRRYCYAGSPKYGVFELYSYGTSE